ncbi:CAP domain-containing protein [Microbacterium luticocti]|uniref:CAP domain-containing protein n=1 Tax=Microbacterium luticocti TaxID=451764 RepID=UPI0003F5EA33|nr:CAP domain-containing protein [Microbacterium luticocti]
MRVALLRRVAAAAVLALAATTITLAGVATPASASTASTIVSLVNRDRAAQGFPALRESTALDAVAQRWAQHMADTATMSHNPNLSGQVPTGWRALGENVANGQPTPQAMEAAWMASPGHRANILGGYTDIGVGWVVVGGHTWGVQVFGTYSAAPAAAKPKPKPAPAKPKPKPAPAKPAPAKPAPAKHAPATSHPAAATPVASARPSASARASTPGSAMATPSPAAISPGTSSDPTPPATAQTTSPTVLPAPALIGIIAAALALIAVALAVTALARRRRA